MQGDKFDFPQDTRIELSKSTACPGSYLKGLRLSMCLQAAGQLQAAVEDLHEANAVLSGVTAVDAPPVEDASAAAAAVVTE